jgi:hypothetical protein
MSCFACNAEVRSSIFSSTRTIRLAFSISGYESSHDRTECRTQSPQQRRQQCTNKSARLQYSSTFSLRRLLQRHFTQQPFVSTQRFQLFLFEGNSSFQQISNALTQTIDEQSFASFQVPPSVLLRQTLQLFQFRQNLPHSRTHLDRFSSSIPPSFILSRRRVLSVVVWKYVSANSITFVRFRFQID